MLSSADLGALLRSEGDFATEVRVVPWAKLLPILLLAAAVHGLVMGAYGLSGAQMLLSAVKVPLLISLSTCLCIPELWIFATVMGLREDFGQILRAILAAQAAVAFVLCQLSPLLLVLYASTDAYRVVQLCNGALFLLASIAGQVILRRHYAPLRARDPRHVHGQRLWFVLYVLVTIQLAWVLRPFIGSPGMGFQFFREEAWGNAYVELLRIFGRWLAA